MYFIIYNVLFYNFEFMKQIFSTLDYYTETFNMTSVHRIMSISNKLEWQSLSIELVLSYLILFCYVA